MSEKTDRELLEEIIEKLHKIEKELDDIKLRIVIWS